MFYFNFSDIFCNNEPKVHDRKYICPIYKNKELIFPNAIPAVYIKPLPCYFMYCNTCKNYVAVFDDSVLLSKN